MPQETNLNVAPYFDDYTPLSNYYKVLFKPGFPVQARELTTLQSMLQDQVESMGNHLFKEGAKIIPGDLTYRRNFYCVQIEPEYLGIPVSLYLDKLVGKRITGRTSGVTAEIAAYITNEESERGNYTLYLNYIDSGIDDDVETFLSGEVLTTNENITYATTFIAAGEGFASTIPSGAPSVGSAMYLNEGIYFLRGYFVDVYDQLLILSQYSNKPSYKIGLDVFEEVISSDVDTSLNDNARGFNNFTAPGADRLKITATLVKKEINDTESQSFVQLAEVTGGILRTINSNTEYNFLGDELAKRTFDESGHYYVKEFVTTVKESLNNELGNRGIYNADQVTYQGNIPSGDLAVYKISSGKAYVRGYEVETLAPTLLDVQKPRTTKLSEDQAINFGFGPTFEVNNVHGSPTLGFSTTNTLSLRNRRVGSNAEAAAGKEIGIARIYDFALESGSYDASFPDTNKWDLTLFDLQTYSDITVNENVTLSSPVFIQGDSSGASAFLRYDVAAGTGITAYEVKGEFFVGERLLFNGVVDDSRFVTAFEPNNVSDIKSVYGIVGSASTFTADIIQKPKTIFGNASITGASSGVSTFTIPTESGQSFVGVLTVGNLVQYSRPQFDVVSYGRVTGIARTNFEISSVQSVVGVCDGSLPTSDAEVSNLQLIQSKIPKSPGSGNLSSNGALFSRFPKSNVSSVNLEGADIIIRRQFETSITNNQTPVITAGTNQVFLPFDEERYNLIRSDGSTEVLTEDKFIFTTGSTEVQIKGLGTNDPNVKLIATLRKSKLTSKVKTKGVSNKIIINKSNNASSGIGTTSLNDGLQYGNYPFGTRVQDSVISLDKPDIVAIYGIYESSDENDPESPNMTTASLDGPTASTNDLIIGEEIIGKVSGARAVYVEKKTDTSINFIYLNDIAFQNNEVISFVASGVNAISTRVLTPGIKITTNYSFVNGQKGSFYDFSRLILRPDAPAPTRKIAVYYSNAFYEDSDDGDITTVNSYNSFNYGAEISNINGIRNTDIIDVRPRVNDNVVTEGARSPLEFLGRSFNDGTNANTQTSRFILASDESMTVSYEYYLPRADRVCVDKNGIIFTIKGVPADNPTLPDEVNNDLNIANVFLPAYLYNVADARVKFVDHKRYQMSDISKLEQRIKNLEYYTSLSILETETLNLFVEDANGQNKFKSGIFVDNFTSLEPQDTSIGIKNSVDRSKGVLRPSHYTTSVNLQLASNAIAGVGTTTAANQDSRFAETFGTNVKKNGQTVTLNHTDVSWLSQPYATRLSSVAPFLSKFYKGKITLEPDVDVWIEVNRLEVRDVQMEGSFLGVAEAMQAEINTNEDGSRSGVSPVIWNSWETTDVNMSLSLDTTQTSEEISTTSSDSQWINVPPGLPAGAANLATPPGFGGIGGGFGPGGFRGGRFDQFGQQINPRGRLYEVSNTVNQTVTTTSIGVQGSTSLTQQRTGTRNTVTEQIDTESLGSRVVNREVIHFMRSRNIEFTAKAMKPYTRVYAFFDGVDINRFVVPKLLQIDMISGVFQVGETVSGRMNQDGIELQAIGTTPRIDFRVANPIHKYGPYNNPTDTVRINPYDRNENLPTIYSESTNILNIDTFSLSSSDFPDFSGYVAPQMILTGASSGAQARVTEIRLVCDRVGTLIGSFKVPDSANPSVPVFETGSNQFRLTSSPINSLLGGAATTAADALFYSQGSIDTTQESTLSLRNARVETATDISESRILDSGIVQSDTIDITAVSNIESDISFDDITPPPPPPPQHSDPLAQTFMVDDASGIFATKIDIFFQSKDETAPVRLELRECNLGQPTWTVLGMSTVELEPDNINTSQDGSVATTFEFESPIYLRGKTEYAIVLLTNVTTYNVWISRLGEADVASADSEAGSVIVTTQPLLGSLFKSQNSSIWTPSQYEDLKFTIHRAEFERRGSVTFYNPDLPSELAAIPPNGIISEPREVRIGIGTTVVDANLQPGRVVKQLTTGANGVLAGFAGSATSDLTLTNAGVGYTPSASQLSYAGVALTSVTGFGIDATANITIQNGVAIAATINNGGKGYAVGDVLTPTQVGNLSLGSGMRLSVSDIKGENELIVNNVQGDFGTTGTDTLYYETTSGVTSAINDLLGGGVVPIAPLRVTGIGTYLKINQRNHGMYSDVNRVTIDNVKSDVPPTTLNQTYSNTQTTFISIDIPDNYLTFENVSVASTNPGYVLINEEIISYTGVDGDTLTGVTRGVNNTVPQQHEAGELVYKYEFNGVSLLRINKTHDLADVEPSSIPYNNSIGIDHYYIAIDMGSDTNAIDRSGGNSGGFLPLYFKQNTIGGGPEVTGSYNLPFTQMLPRIRTITPTGTNIDNSFRTISGTSVDSNKPSFVDQGYVSASLFEDTLFDTPRIIASKTNETLLLDDEIFLGKKSFTYVADLSTTDPRVTPAIDLNHSNIVFTNNRVNQPVTDYATDKRVNNVVDDPNKFIYVSKNVVLENPATSLQVLLDAYVSNFNDIRVFYALNQNTISDETVFVPFPGFANIDINGSVIDPANNNGLSDEMVSKIDTYTSKPSFASYREHKYTIDNLVAFDSFRIKIIGTSTNMAIPPQIRNLRVISFA